MESLKILIVEDDPTTCALLKTTLEMEGHRISFVHGIVDKEILSLLNREQPDILFLDFYLGTEETVPYLASIRADARWRTMPVLMTSAIDHSRECLAAGADDFVLKPFNWDELIQKMNNVHTKFLREES